jgi:hypothetical protein
LYGHPEFQITISNMAVPEVDIAWILSVLEGMVASGAKFEAGETVQIGWMLTKLAQGANGALIVTEPDMKSFPIVFVDSVDATASHLRCQVDSVESFLRKDDAEFPSLLQSVVVHANYKHARRVVFERLDANGSDSGWWLSDLADPLASSDASRFSLVSLYQLAIDRPELIKFFAFPPGLQIVFDGRTGVTRDGEELPVRPGSFIDQLMSQ